MTEKKTFSVSEGAQLNTIKLFFGKMKNAYDFKSALQLKFVTPSVHFLVKNSEFEQLNFLWMLKKFQDLFLQKYTDVV